MNLDMIDKKYWIGGGILLLLLSLIGGYFAKDFKKQYESEHTARIESEKHEITLMAEKTILEGRLQRAIKSTSRPALDGKGKAIHNADGSVAMETSFEDVMEQYSLTITSLDGQVKTLTTEKKELQEKLSLKESSQPSAHRFGLGVESNFVGDWYGTLGFKQPLGFADLQIQASNKIGLVLDARCGLSLWF